MVCCQLTLCGDASSKRLPGIIPAGYVSHTGYQYDSISRVAGHRELAPTSKFSKLGGFNRIVFITSGILHPQLMFLANLIRILPRSGGAALPSVPSAPIISNSLLDFLAAPNTQIFFVFHQL